MRQRIVIAVGRVHDGWGPMVLMRIGDHRGAQGAELDIAVAVHEAVATVEKAGFVATFPQCAAAVIAVIDITPAMRTQRARWRAVDEGLIAGHIVGHQHVDMHGIAFVYCGFAQQRAVTEVF